MLILGSWIWNVRWLNFEIELDIWNLVVIWIGAWCGCLVRLRRFRSQVTRASPGGRGSGRRWAAEPRPRPAQGPAQPASQSRGSAPSRAASAGQTEGWKYLKYVVKHKSAKLLWRSCRKVRGHSQYKPLMKY